ncbi:metallophosphoesterase family protein [Shimazuella kribbensis]|uniref:metallophosphoesterase family protein n=1 Tax=Shimazuella kribbensis TaxID=139808 RepID=UPI0004008AF8|nr:metallophosphoesterase [Shimazuella kribbensis]
MKVLVTSDSHGKASLLAKIVEQEKADYVIHCGDFCTEKKQLPSVAMTVVRGNCDFEEVANEAEVNLAGYRFYVTHGHRYQVKNSLLPLSLLAQEKEADIVCFGHSHFPLCEQEGRKVFLNPGSIQSPRGYTVPTYAIVHLNKDRHIKVNYFEPNGNGVPNLGGSFLL